MYLRSIFNFRVLLLALLIASAAQRKAIATSFREMDPISWSAQLSIDLLSGGIDPEQGVFRLHQYLDSVHNLDIHPLTVASTIRSIYPWLYSLPTHHLKKAVTLVINHYLAQGSGKMMVFELRRKFGPLIESPGGSEGLRARAQTNVEYINAAFNLPGACADGPCPVDHLKIAWLLEVNAATEANRMIPTRPSDENLRFISWNVHYFTDLMQQDTTAAALRELVSLNPDIAGLQEVVWTKALEQSIKSYFGNDIHIYFCEAADWSITEFGGPFGNLIISRVKPLAYSELQLGEFRGEGRCAQFLEWKDHWGNHHVFGNLHLDVFDASGTMRSRQLEITIDRLETIGSPDSEVVLAGDFNALLDHQILPSQKRRILAADRARLISTPFHELTQLLHRGYSEVFDLGNLPAPISTSWTGRKVDHIFVKSNTKMTIDGIYLHSNSHSDHRMLVMDASTRL